MKKHNYLYFNTDYLDIWKLFNVKKNTYYSEEYIDSIYSSLLKNKIINSSNYNEYLFSWKLLKDHYYLNCYSKYYSINTLYEAGFFIDFYDLFENKGINDNDWINTPINKIKVNSNSKEKVVILMTGAFSPLHEGHIECLELSKKILSNQYDVIGGYLSHSHDLYVDQKYNGNASKNALLRIKQAEYMLSDNDWIMVDKYESIDNKYPINFTDVIKRLKSYINYHFNINVKVAYVFGGDNSKFTLAFENEDISVCVSRNHKNEDFFNNFKLKNNNFLIQHNIHKNISSSIKRKYHNLNNENINKTVHYLIRDDSEYIQLPQNFNLIDSFLEIIKKGLNTNIEIHTINLKQQNELFFKNYRNIKNTISLDVYIKGDYNINLSREFNLSDSQIKPNRLINRPFNTNTTIQNIPEGQYTLIEDDSVSGKTISFLKKMLPDNVSLENIILLSDLYKNNIEYFDVIDLRDFILNTNEGGLVVSFKNKSFRVPYLYPYVNLETRANILPDKIIFINLLLWKLNLKIFENLKKENKTIQLNENLKTLMLFTNKYNQSIDTLDNVILFCKFHILHINNILKKNEK